VGYKQRDISGPGGNLAAGLEGGEPKARPVGRDQAKASLCREMRDGPGLQSRGGIAVKEQNGVTGRRTILGVREHAAIGKSDGLGVTSGGCAGMRA
jgi:hypothetical protein